MALSLSVPNIFAIFLIMNAMNGLQGAYIQRPLSANESCISSSNPMAGFHECPAAPFKVVNTSNHVTNDINSSLTQLKQELPADCYAIVLKLFCVMKAGACSDDEKYVVLLYNVSGCIHYLECLPKEAFSEGDTTSTCMMLAEDITNSVVPGPTFDIIPKASVSSARHVYEQVTTVIAFVSLLTILYLSKTEE